MICGDSLPFTLTTTIPPSECSSPQLYLMPFSFTLRSVHLHSFATWNDSKAISLPPLMD
jgi:hypothetical protein